MSLFQGIIIGILIVAAIGGVLLFALSRSDSGEVLETLTLWGTIPHADMDPFLTAIVDSKNSNMPPINYVYLTRENFEHDFLEALATGLGPDLVLLPHEELLAQKNKLFTIPYKDLPVRTFRELFLEAGEVFFTSTGTIGLPFSIDPIVTYWNRTQFSKAGIAQVPKYWDEVITVLPRLILKDASGGINTAGLALGEFSNTSYAKDIIASLLMQSGSSIVGLEGDRLVSFINKPGPYSVAPADTAITFFTQFSNPIKSYYTWSKSLPNSIEFFSQGDLAMLFAKASDIKRIADKNPNLNFDVTEFPITRDEANGTPTFGSMYGFGVVDRSPNFQSAINTAFQLTSKESLTLWENISGLPPVRRDMLAVSQEDPYKTVFYNAALRAKVWYDPDPIETELIFKDMVEAVATGRLQIGASAREADNRLNTLLNSQ